MPCLVIMKDCCPKKHKLTWRCSKLRPASCSTCDLEARMLVEQQERDAQLDQVRQQKQAQYARQLAEIQERVDRARREIQELNEDDEKDAALRQRQKDLDNALRTAERFKKQRQSKKVKLTEAGPQTHERSEEDTVMQDTGEADPHKDDAGSVADLDSNAQKLSSAARDDWEHQKRVEGATNEHLDELMSMIGLENVKEAFLDIKAKVDLAVRQDVSLAKERVGASLLGNPGTGKTTLARIYAKFLTSVGALPGDEFVETTGAKSANEGVQGCQNILDDIKKAGGGALFIDEAYQLTSGSSFGGAAVLDLLLAEVENLTGKVVFIPAGYNKNMESFFAHNPGLPSRFPRQIQFDDYEDDELLKILNYGLEKRYDQRIAVTCGLYGLYARIVARRLGRGRGKVGFGNARAVENMLSVIASRQAKRVQREAQWRSS